MTQLNHPQTEQRHHKAITINQVTNNNVGVRKLLWMP